MATKPVGNSNWIWWAAPLAVFLMIVSLPMWIVYQHWFNQRTYAYLEGRHIAFGPIWIKDDKKRWYWVSEYFPSTKPYFHRSGYDLLFDTHWSPGSPEEVRNPVFTNNDLRAALPLDAVIRICIHQSAFPEPDFKLIGQFLDLNKLEMWGYRLKRADVAALAKLPKLREVCCYAVEFEPGALNEWANSKSLESIQFINNWQENNQPGLDASGLDLRSAHQLRLLDIWIARLDESAIRNLTEIPALKELHFRNIFASQEAWRQLNQAVYLEKLSIGGGVAKVELSAVRPDNWKSMRSLVLSNLDVPTGFFERFPRGNLHDLLLHGIKVTPEMIRAIGKIDSLRSISMDDRDLGNEQWAVITGCGNLYGIAIQHPGIKPEWIESIGRMSQLKNLHLTGTRLTVAQVALLQSLPALESFTYTDDAGVSQTKLLRDQTIW